MKVHQLARGFWEHEPSLSCKPLNPLPHPSSVDDALSSFHHNTFITPKTTPTNPHSHQVDMQAGGTRWNPTQEQVGILEMIYRGGMRTPNARQIEQITALLSKFGRIQGKTFSIGFKTTKHATEKRRSATALGGLAISLETRIRLPP
ncbi:Poly(A) binding protein 8 isoform 1 [Hibiscus syriacus]|uniref:Poly(A) binding protein 8 isoform 1 n=1 Tax=Hibiscus syriacus TaxID=106335 RepID=A0A6A2YV04_HIBSY|nr:Poly(A) binding protein 8 isoform 1 [Hibiscus syriacus]